MHISTPNSQSVPNHPIFVPISENLSTVINKYTRHTQKKILEKIISARTTKNLFFANTCLEMQKNESPNMISVLWY